MAGNKEYDFIVTLKKTGFIYLNIISILLCLLAVAVSVFGLIYTGSAYTSFYAALALNTFIIAFLLIHYFNGSYKYGKITFRWALTAGAVLWFLPPQSNLLIALLYVVASFTERQLKLPQEIGFDKEEIVINSFPSKQYSWQEINNVILKDNILTIDFKSNKLLQKETESDVSSETEKEFNEFCASNIGINNIQLS